MNENMHKSITALIDKIVNDLNDTSITTGFNGYRVEKKNEWKRITALLNNKDANNIYLNSYVNENSNDSRRTLLSQESFYRTFKDGYIFIFTYKVPLSVSNKHILAIQSNKEGKVIELNDERSFQNNLAIIVNNIDSRLNDVEQFINDFLND